MAENLMQSRYNFRLNSLIRVIGGIYTAILLLLSHYTYFSRSDYIVNRS